MAMDIETNGIDGSTLKIEHARVEKKGVLRFTISNGNGECTATLDANQVRAILPAPYEFVRCYQPRVMGPMWQLFCDVVGGEIRKDRMTWEVDDDDFGPTGDKLIEEHRKEIEAHRLQIESLGGDPDATKGA